MTEFVKGQRIVLPKEQHLESHVGYVRAVPAGTLGTVQAVGTAKLRVEFDGFEYVSTGWGVSKTPKPELFWVSKSIIETADPNAPRPRQLGEVPEGGISPTDPRLMWLWDDAAALAKSAGYCSTYDTLTAELGIPGRPRNFKVTVVLAPGVTTTVTEKARTKAEAEERVRVRLADAKPTVGTASV